VKAAARREGIRCALDLSRGKGSHANLYFGDRFTIVKDRKKADRAGASGIDAGRPRSHQRGYKMSTFCYPFTIAVDEAGFYLVKFPDLPGAATDGKTREEAVAEAEDCLAEAVAGYIVRRQKVPEPSSKGDACVSLDPLLAAKAALNNVMIDSAVSRTDLANRMGVDEKVVRRLLDPKHQSHIRAVLRAAAVLGLKAEVRFELLKVPALPLPVLRRQ
jgi:antitoxin HicB